jgi:thioredoxin 1
MLTLTNDNFKTEVLESTTLVVVDFFATWCSPCHLLLPTLKQLDSVKIGKVNVDENPELAINYQVAAVPTVLFFKNGKMVKRVVGLHNEEFFKETLKELN